MLNKYFSKIIFLFINLGLLTSCFQDPLSEVPKELTLGFSKQSYDAPNSLKLNRFADDSVKLTINDSSQLIMKFKEERNSTYNFVIRSAVVPNIQISKVELKGFPEELVDRDMKFDFDKKKGEGSFSWTPKSTFVQGSMYRSFPIDIRMSFDLKGSTGAIIDREILVYVEKSFYTPELIGFEFGYNDFQPVVQSKSAVAYIHPFLYERLEESGLSLIDSIANLKFRIKDKNYISAPTLESEEISDQRLFSVFIKNLNLKTELIADTIWSLIYQFDHSIFHSNPEGVNRNFETKRMKVYASSLGYKSNVQIILFNIFPIINPEYEILNSEIQDSQNISFEQNQSEKITTIDKSIVSVRDRIKVRYTIEKSFVAKYISFFNIPHERYQNDEREYASHEIGVDKTTFSNEVFFRNILDFNSRAYSMEKQFSYGQNEGSIEPCKKYVSQKNPNVSYDNIICFCDEDFAFSEDKENYYLEKICSLGVNFSISSARISEHKMNDEVHEYYLSNSLAFSEMDVFKKIFSIEKYKQRKYNISKFDYGIDKDIHERNPKNTEPYPEYVNPYKGYTDRQFYQLLKKERVAMLHSKEIGQWNRELHFIYDLKPPNLNCSQNPEVIKEGFMFSCKITYFFSDSAFLQIEQSKSLDIKLDFLNKENHQCDEIILSKTEGTISKTCLIKSKIFSFISSLERKDPYTIILRSDTLGTVLTNEAFEFMFQDGSISQKGVKYGEF